MDKQIEYKGYKFNVTVELNTKIEKCLNGKRFHTVRVNDLGPSNYYVKKEIEDSKLFEAIEAMQNDAKLLVDKRNGTIKDTTVAILEKLGFSNDAIEMNSEKQMEPIDSLKHDIDYMIRKNLTNSICVSGANIDHMEFLVKQKNVSKKKMREALSKQMDYLIGIENAKDAILLKLK